MHRANSKQQYTQSRLLSKEFKETSMLFYNSITHFFSRSSGDLLLNTEVAEEKVQPKSSVCQIK